MIEFEVTDALSDAFAATSTTWSTSRDKERFSKFLKPPCREAIPRSLSPSLSRSKIPACTSAAADCTDTSLSSKPQSHPPSRPYASISDIYRLMVLLKRTPEWTGPTTFYELIAGCRTRTAEAADADLLNNPSSDNEHRKKMGKLHALLENQRYSKMVANVDPSRITEKTAFIPAGSIGRSLGGGSGVAAGVPAGSTVSEERQGARYYVSGMNLGASMATMFAVGWFFGKTAFRNSFSKHGPLVCGMIGLVLAMFVEVGLLFIRYARDSGVLQPHRCSIPPMTEPLKPETKTPDKHQKAE